MAIRYTYTTQADIERVLSAAGVTLRADDDDDGIHEGTVVTDCIEEATDDLNTYLLERYLDSDLNGNEWIRRKTTRRAALLLCMRRGNPPPASLAKQWEADKLLFEEIKAQKRNVPRLRNITGRAPVMSNQMVDSRYHRRKLRTQTEISTGQPGQLPRDDTVNIPEILP